MADQLQEQNPDQKRRQFWQSHLKAWSLTGLSQIEYCRQNDLKANRFTYWKRKFQRENLPVEFVRIPAEPVKSALLFCNNEASLHLTVDSRFTIEIPDGFTPVTLEQVLLTLQGIWCFCLQSISKSIWPSAVPICANPLTDYPSLSASRWSLIPSPAIYLLFATENGICLKSCTGTETGFAYGIKDWRSIFSNGRSQKKKSWP